MAESPDWQPISRLPLIGSMIDGMLQDAEEPKKNASYWGFCGRGKAKKD